MIRKAGSVYIGMAGLAYLGLPYDFKPDSSDTFFVMDKLTFNSNYKKGKANGGAAPTEAYCYCFSKKYLSHAISLHRPLL